MFIVLVKHYLTTDGISFLHQNWLPRVKDIMSQQEGYISVVHDAEKDHDDCVNIIVTFKNQETLNNWANHPEHGSLVNALDSYRNRDYWEAGIIGTTNSEIEWERIEVPCQAATK